MRIQAGPWQVEADPEATARVHDSMESGSPERCACRDCRNFIAARSVAYPPEARDLFRRLGIRGDRESEVGGAVGLGSRFLYAGWFHLVGRILDEPEWQPHAMQVNHADNPALVTELRFHNLAPQFGILLRTQRHLLPAEFGTRGVVQLDFTTELPWVLTEPPDVAQG